MAGEGLYFGKIKINFVFRSTCTIFVAEINEIN